MPEWWTYRPEDFLLFSARAYYRLFERHNEAVWPAQIVTILLGLLILLLLYQRKPAPERTAAAVLAGVWAWVGSAFLLERYSEINVAAGWLAGLFGLEGALLVWGGVVRSRLRFPDPRHAPGAIGLALFVVALLVYPVLAPALGRPWRQAEVFGIAPDPTAVATLGLLVAAEAPRWLLLAPVALWCVLSGVTLWTLGSPDAWLPFLSVSAAVLAAALRSPPAKAGD